MAKFDFTFDVRCFPKLANHPQLGRVLGEMADDAADEARAIAPYDEGDYRDSIGSTVVHDEGVLKGIVYSDDPKAMWLEFGTEDTPTFATLRRSLDVLKGAI